MSSWERPRPPHLDRQNNLEVNKPVRTNGQHYNERASTGSGSGGASSSHRGLESSSSSPYPTSKNGFSAGSAALPPRPSSGLYPPASAPPPQGKERYMPNGALDKRNSHSVAIPLSSSHAGSRDTYRETPISSGSSHRRRESQASLVDDRDQPYSRPLDSEQRISNTSTNNKKPRKPPVYVPSFIPTFDAIEVPTPVAPVASGSATSIITELAQNDIDRMNAQQGSRSYPSSSSNRQYPLSSLSTGHPTSSRYAQPQRGPSNGSWPSENGISPIGRSADLPRRPSIDHNSRRRSVSRDSRGRIEHWSPSRRRHDGSMERSLSRDDYRRRHSPRRYDRSPTRERRSDHWRGASPSPPPRRQYRDDSVDSRGYPYRSRTISRSPARERVYVKEDGYSRGRRKDDYDYIGGRSREEDRRNDPDLEGRTNGHPRREERGRADRWFASRSPSRSPTRRRDSLRRYDERPPTPNRDDLPTVPTPQLAVLEPPAVREPVKISFGAKPKVVTNNGLAEKPPDFHFRRDLDAPRRKYESEDQGVSSPSHEGDRIQPPEPERIPSPPPMYIPPPPPSVVKQEIGRGNFRVLNPISKVSYKRVDGVSREGEDEVIVEDPRLTMSKARLFAGVGFCENRVDGLLEVPRYAWNTQSSGPAPATAICISGLSHLTTQSDIASRIGGLAKQFTFSDSKVKGQAKIADIDVLLNKITGASSGLCRVTFEGKYPLPAKDEINRDSTKRKTWQADVKAGQVIAANKFAQHVVKTLDNTRIGPSYKVPNERVRVMLDGQKAKIDQLYKLVLAGKPPILPEAERKRDSSNMPNGGSAEAAPLPLKPVQPVSTPTPTVPQRTPVVPQSPASLAGGATPAIGGPASSYIPAVPLPIMSQPRPATNAYQNGGNYSQNPMQNRYGSGAKYAHMPFHPFHNVASVPAADVPQEPKYNMGQYGPFHPLNPHAGVNKLLRNRYEENVRAYEDKKARQSRQARPPVSRDSFTDIPFRPKTTHQDLYWRTGDRDSRVTDSRQADGSTEVSSDAEAEESDTDRDVIIDPKKRHERHKGQAKIMTTPVKSTAASRPPVTPVALDRDKVGALLLKNGFPYIYVPMVAEMQRKEPLRQLKQYFKGCLDVLADSSGYYILFNSTFKARICLDLAKMAKFPLGTIHPEFKEAKKSEPAVPTAPVIPEGRDEQVNVVKGDTQTDSSIHSDLVPEVTATSTAPSLEADKKPSLQSHPAKPQPKGRKKIARRVASESPTPEVDMSQEQDPKSLVMAQSGRDALPSPSPGIQPTEIEMDSKRDQAVPDSLDLDGEIEKLIKPEAETETIPDPVLVPVSHFVDSTLNKKPEEVEDSQVTQVAEVPSVVAPPKKGGKRKTVAKEDKQQPPKKKAKKGKATRLVEDPVDVPIDIAEDVDMDAPAPPAKPSELDPLKNGLAQDEEDLFLLRLVVESKATGEVPLLPEEKAALEEEALLEGVVDTVGEPEEQDGYIHPSGCARSHGYYKISALDKSAYLPQRNRAIVEVDHPAGATSASGNNNAVASSRSARVATRRFVQGMEQSKKAADADSDVFAFNQLRTRKKQLKFQRSPIHDWGLYAAESITVGEMVIEYVGEVIRAQVADIREKWYEKIGIGSSYLFRVDDDAVVDATKKGSMARLINHCCTPNCTAKIITINGEKKIVIYAKTNILPGDEITYDYHFPIESPENKVICLCGSARCRGFLN